MKIININNEIIPEISIIIVNYNSAGLLANCIESIKSNVKINHEVIIFDNNSHDDSLDSVEKSLGSYTTLKIIQSPDNIGFAKANNHAAKYAGGKYFHFLNPDTIVNTCLNEEYSKLLANKMNAIFVTGLTESDGQIHKMGHLIPTIGNYLKALIGSKKVRTWNIGASIIMHRSTFDRIGGWAEDYFMYAEDLDLFYTAFKNNIPVVYLECNITHIGKGTTAKVWSPLQRSVLIEKSTRKFYKKHRMVYQYFFIRPAQLLFILFRDPKIFILTLSAIVKSFKNNEK